MKKMKTHMRPPFSVTEQEIDALDPIAFADLMNLLLRLEGGSIGLPPVQLQTSLRIDDPDGGVDARVFNASIEPQRSEAQNNLEHRWIPQGTSIWQFKSGNDHTPGHLKTELKKPRVKEVLLQGGSYVLVIGQGLSDVSAERRKKVLEECCKELNVPAQQCLLYYASHIARWASKFPAVCCKPYFNRPSLTDWMRWESWANNERFQQEFKPDVARRDILAQIRSHLLQQTDRLHFRIEGLAGIGKTRLALEILRPQGDASTQTDSLHDLAMYAGRPEDIPSGLFAWLEDNAASSLILVVDECDLTHADRLDQQIRRCNGRARLLTIGLSQEARAVSMRPPGHYLLDSLNDAAMRDLLKGAYSRLTAAAIDYIAHLSSGFVKLATAIAESVTTHPELMNAHGIVRSQEIRNMLRLLLPAEEDFRAMQVAALLSRIGWEGDLAAEGKTVAAFMGISWQDAVHRIQRQINEGLVSKQGRYRYVTPHLLAVWLAGEAWEAHGGELLKLLEILPSWNSRHSMLERLRDLGDHQQARQVVETLLRPDGDFRDWHSIDNERGAEILQVLTEADPRAGMNALRRLLESLPRDELQRLNRGRQYVLWTLQKLAWPEDTFFEAARLLLALAEAENQTWANNASGIWTGLFATHLGGTSVPALKRHVLIEEALDDPSVERQLLAVRAIATALSSHEARNSGAERLGGYLPLPEWRPQNRQEDQQVRLSALTMLDRAIRSSEDRVREAARDFLLGGVCELIGFGLADPLLERLEQLPVRNDADRHKLRNALETILEWGSASLSQVQCDRARALLNSLNGHSYHERLRRWLGKWTVGDWQEDKNEKRAENNAIALADEALQMPDLLLPEIDWLFTSDAANGHLFARRLGELDEHKIWWQRLASRLEAGKGEPLISTYLQGHVDAGRKSWRDAVLDAWVQEGETKAYAVLDAVWRGNADNLDAIRLIELIHQGHLSPASIRVLVWGGQTSLFSIETFRDLIAAALRSKTPIAAETAVDLLSQRVKFHPTDKLFLKELVWQALECCTYPFSDKVVESDWNELAKLYLSDDPVRVARRLLTFLAGEASTKNYIRRASHSVETFIEATHLAPSEVWETTAPYLLRLDRFSMLLRMMLQGWYAQEIDAETLLEWAENNRPDGPAIIAHLAQVSSAPLEELARELLIRYGNDKAVTSALYATYHGGSFSGPLSGWYRQRLRTAREWLKDSAPAVRKWARLEVDTLEEQLKQAESDEIEMAV